MADEYLERPPKGVEVDPLFREIMSEPFTGEHWGPGYDEEVHQGWTDSEEDDRITESDEEIVTPLPTTARPATGPSPREVEAQRRAEAEQRLLMAKLSLRELSRNAYWKTGGAPLVVEEGVHGWQKLSSRRSSPHLDTNTSSPSHVVSCFERTSRGQNHFCWAAPTRTPFCTHWTTWCAVFLQCERRVPSQETAP